MLTELEALVMPLFCYNKLMQSFSIQQFLPIVCFSCSCSYSGVLQSALFPVWSRFCCLFPGHGSAAKLRTAEQELFSNLQAWATLWRLMQLLIVVVVVAAAAAGVGADEGAATKSTSTSLLHRGHLGCDFSSITYMRQCVQAPMTSCAQLPVSSCSDDACCCFLLLLLLSTSPA